MGTFLSGIIEESLVERDVKKERGVVFSSLSNGSLVRGGLKREGGLLL